MNTITCTHTYNMITTVYTSTCTCILTLGKLIAAEGFFGGRPLPPYKIGLARFSAPKQSLKRDLNLMIKQIYITEK